MGPGVKDGPTARRLRRPLRGPGHRDPSRKDLADYRGGGPGVARSPLRLFLVGLPGVEVWPFGPLTIHKTESCSLTAKTFVDLRK